VQRENPLAGTLVLTVVLRIPLFSWRRGSGLLLGLAAVAALAGCGDGEASASGESAERPLAVKSVFGEVGLSPGQFTYPRVIENDGKSLYVIDKAAHVQRLDPATGLATAMWTMPDSVLGKPCGATWGPDGLLYVADTHYFRVMVYRPPAGLGQDAELVSKWGEYGNGPGQFVYVTDVGILTGPDGGIERIYVSEYGGNDRVSVFDKDRKFLFSFGQQGSGAQAEPVEFNRPQSIGVDKERKRLVITDAVNHRIGVFTLDGKLIRWIGSPEHAGRGRDEFAYPYGLALLPDGSALVTEFGNHRVHHVDVETGATLGLYGTPGRGPGELTNPWGVTVMGKTVYVLDSGNARVQSFALGK
jgi:DNA-binding beta-propeller fold protein YncE